MIEETCEECAKRAKCGADAQPLTDKGEGRGVCMDFVRDPAARLLRSMECIRGWCAAAVEHRHPFGNNLASALLCVSIEADAAIKYESEVRNA